MIRKLLSYIVYGLLWVMSLLPLGLLYIFSDIVYFIVYHVVRYRRKVVDINLQKAFPEKTDKERNIIRRRFFRHLCDMFFETIRLWNIGDEAIKKRCKFNNPEVFDKYFAGGQNVIAVMGHYGNWELMASYPLWNNKCGLRPIYKPLHNKAMDMMYHRIRSSFGAIPLPKNDTLRVMINAKKSGENTVTCFLADQTPNKFNLNYWTDFLNQDTPVLVGTGRIAKKLNQAVVFVYMKKVKRGYYEVDMYPLFEDTSKVSEAEITERHTKELERIIRKQPEYWLWSHRRWKHKRTVEE